MRKKKQNGKNLRLGILFAALVLALIIISLSFELINLLGKSRFDWENQFVLSTSSADKAEIISFSPKTDSIFIAQIEGRVGDPGKFLGLAVNGIYKDYFDFSTKNITSNLFLMLSKTEASKTNLTVVDIARLIIFARTVPESQITEEQVSQDVTALELGDLLSNFIDPAISDEKKSIEIINATDTPGLAGRLANVVTNMGGNVILVTTSDKTEMISQIKYRGDKSYTVSKLSKTLGFKTVENKENSLSDVIIVIGKDMEEGFPY